MGKLVLCFGGSICETSQNLAFCSKPKRVLSNSIWIRGGKSISANVSCSFCKKYNSWNVFVLVFLKPFRLSNSAATLTFSTFNSEMLDMFKGCSDFPACTWYGLVGENAEFAGRQSTCFSSPCKKSDTILCCFSCRVYFSHIPDFLCFPPWLGLSLLGKEKEWRDGRQLMLPAAEEPCGIKCDIRSSSYVLATLMPCIWLGMQETYSLVLFRLLVF